MAEYDPRDGHTNTGICKIEHGPNPQVKIVYDIPETQTVIKIAEGAARDQCPRERVRDLPQAPG